MAGEVEVLRPEDVIPPSQVELLTAQFYRWEIRGRGWLTWGDPVALEPPFRPFFGHYAPPVPSNIVDDARKPTLLSSFVEKIKILFTGGSVRPDGAALFLEQDVEEPEPEWFEECSDLVELHVSIPPTLKISRDAAEQFLLSLSYASSPVSFEIIGQRDSIIVQIACREEDLLQLRQQLEAHFPDAVVTEERDGMKDRWETSGAGEAVVVDFGLSHEFMQPLRTFRGFDVDPLIGITAALSDLQDGEVGVFQVLLQSARSPWAENVLRAVTDWDGKSFFSDAPGMVSLARDKVARPLYAAMVRVGAKSHSRDGAWRIAKSLGGALAQFASPTSNEFIPLENDGYPDDGHEADLLERRSRRSGMLLNSEELVSLVHLPSVSVRAEKLVRETEKTKAAPQIATGQQLVLGENVHAGETRVVSLSPDQRVRHTYLIGASGTGKSTLLLNLIIQDMKNGEGVGVLDPHGDLIEQILGHVPEERIEDVVLLDPSDEEYPVGFNILSAHSSVEQNLLASDLVGIFRRLSTSWGDQMTSVLGNAILAFLESDRGGTLADLRRFLVEPDFRKAFLPSVRDSEVVYYWQKEFHFLTGKPQGPILTRLDTFLRPKLIRRMVSQKENRLDFAAMMNEKKIFLAKLAQGMIGEENAYLLGALLVSKFHQLVMSRQETSESARTPFYLYIDEFHHFITPSMAQLLSGARKYRLGLVLAHQDLRQLWSRDPDVASAVLSNPATRICFRVGEQDAEKLEDGFSFFDAKDLKNLGTGEAICRVERSDYDFNLKTLPLPAEDVDVARARRKQVIGRSREKYARRWEDVEAELSREAIPVEPPPVREEPKREEPRKRETRQDAPQGETKREKTTARPEPRERPHAPPIGPPSLGRGGQQHKYLQNLIKRWAEDRGWRAIIEKQILDGLGSVDVALEKEGQSIACEISVTSTSEQEIGNVQKCVAAGFDHIFVLSTERKALAKIERLLDEALSRDRRDRVRCLTPEEAFAFLETLDAQSAATEQTVRGYKVKVRYQPLSEEEKKARKEAISKVILDAMKRMKRKPE